MLKLSILVFFFSSTSALAIWDELDWDLAFTTEAMIFDNDKVAETNDEILSFIPQVTVSYFGDHFMFRLAPRYRFDTFDSNRDMFLLDDSYVGWENDWFAFKAGALILNFGAMHAFSPMNWINTRVIDSLYSGFSKMGEPAMSFKFRGDNNALELVYLPFFTAPYWPDSTSRMGVGINFDKDLVVTSSGATENPWRMDQFAALYHFSGGKLEAKLGYFRMIDKSFSLIGIDAQAQFNRYYYYMDMLAMSAQYAMPGFTINAEVYGKNYDNHQAEVIDLNAFPDLEYRNQSPVNHQGISIGADIPRAYSFDQSGVWLLEYQYLFGAPKNLLRLYSVFQNAVLLGYRHSFNNFANSEFTTSVAMDLSGRGDRLYLVNYSQNVWNSMKWDLGLRVVETGASSERGVLNENAFAGLALIDRSDGIYSTLTYYWD